MSTKCRAVAAPVLLAILALAIHVVLVPPMSVGAGWAALCSPDGERTVVPLGGMPPPGGLGDCDDCPVCPTAHGLINPKPTAFDAFDRQRETGAPWRCVSGAIPSRPTASS